MEGAQTLKPSKPCQKRAYSSWRGWHLNSNYRCLKFAEQKLPQRQQSSNVGISSPELKKLTMLPIVPVTPTSQSPLLQGQLKKSMNVKELGKQFLSKSVSPKIPGEG